MRGDEFTQRGMTRSRSLRRADVLWLTLALGMGHLLKLFLAHRRDHRFRCALELALGRVAALGRQGGAGSFLLGSGFGWHVRSPQLLRIKRSEERRVGKECRYQLRW